MTKLKTVKELGNDENWIGRLILKKEAIKWVLKVPITKLDVEAWMEFHNITDEDLK